MIVQNVNFLLKILVKKSRLIQLFFLLFLLTSCSDILYWNKENNLDNITPERQALQLDRIKKSDPIEDSNWAHIFFDNRLVIATTGMGEVVGIEDRKLRVQLGEKGIWGNTDLNTDEVLFAWSAKYALAYNENILKLIGKKNSFVGVEERKRLLIDNLTKIEDKKFK